MILHQLFEPDTATYTYILGDEGTREAVIIDPVLGRRERDLEALRAAEVKLSWILDTHVHADHVTGANALKVATGAMTAIGEACRAPGYDRALNDGDRIVFGGESLLALATPGHTPGSLSYLWKDCVFTGDSLLIGGCGRTDFQEGDARALYTSITRKLFTLPESTRVLPGHDYRRRTESSIGEERRTNPRLAGVGEDAFIRLMAGLNLAPPRRIDDAVPLNRNAGVLSEGDTPWASVSPTMANQALRGGHAKLADLRDAREHEESRPPGAVSIPDADLGRLEGLAKGCETLYIVCRTGKRSMLAARALAERGVLNVASVAGGMLAWRESGAQVESGTGKP